MEFIAFLNQHAHHIHREKLVWEVAQTEDVLLRLG